MTTRDILTTVREDSLTLLHVNETTTRGAYRARTWSARTAYRGQPFVVWEEGSRRAWMRAPPSDDDDDDNDAFWAAVRG